VASDRPHPSVPAGRPRPSLALLVDVGVVVLLAVVTTVYYKGPLSLPTLAFVVLPLLFRRRAPIPVLATTAFGALLTTGHAEGVDIAAVGLAAYSVGDLVPDRVGSTATALLAVFGLTVGFLAQGADTSLSLVLPVVVVMPTWTIGTLVRSRRLDAEAREAARLRALADREAALEATIANQRRTIARELHDVVAHAVSVMVIQAGAARSVLHTSPAEAETALLAVESTGRDAMAELRRLLDLLAEEPADAGAPIAPQAGMAQLESLVARVREAGLPAELLVEGTPRPLPAGMDVTVYRIVQEALTNALRYAGRARTVVRLAFFPSELQVEVLDDGPVAKGSPPSDGETSKRGLVGMSERAALFGGRVEAGPRDDRGYAVRAWLPTHPSV
jgi:signal transduction histidine kinase